MNKKLNRITNMEQILQSKGLVKIKEMADLLEVSEMTVRRDIRQMEMAGKVKNLNGMLISPNESSFTMVSKKYDLHRQAKDQNLEKAAIGAMAASRISAGDSVMLDVGSTIEHIARHAPQNVKFEALCLSLNTLQCLLDKPLAVVAVAGGYYQPSTQMFLSDDAVRFIRSIRANKVFLSAAGIHEDLGLSCANPYEVAVKKAYTAVAVKMSTMELSALCQPGGTFYGFNPQNNASEGANTNFLTTKYAVTFANGYYTVVESVAHIDGFGYATITDAINAAKDKALTPLFHLRQGFREAKNLAQQVQALYAFLEEIQLAEKEMRGYY